MDTYTLFALISHLVRTVVLVAVVALAVVLLIDWLSRTRRLNPFNPLARTMRRVVDPLLAPVERRIVRAGGLPSHAPAWAMVGAIIIGVLLVSAVDFVLGNILSIWMAASAGPMGLFVLLLRATFGILRIAIIIVVIVSWLPISPFSPWVRWAFAITEPIMRPLRQIVPRLGAFDITPIVAYLLLGLLESAFLRLF